VNIQKIESILEVYTIEDILELNDLTVADALLLLHEENIIVLPDPKPLDFND
jgi:hypothetical protein